MTTRIRVSRVPENIQPRTFQNVECYPNESCKTAQELAVTHSFSPCLKAYGRPKGRHQACRQRLIKFQLSSLFDTRHSHTTASLQAFPASTPNSDRVTQIVNMTDSPSPGLESWRFDPNLMGTRDSKELIRESIPADKQHPPRTDLDEIYSDSDDHKTQSRRQRLIQRLRSHNIPCIPFLDRLVSHLPKRKSIVRTATKSPACHRTDTIKRKSILKPARVSTSTPTETTTIVNPSSSSSTTLSDPSPVLASTYHGQDSIEFWLAMIRANTSSLNEPYLASLTLHLTTASPPDERQAIITATARAASDLAYMVALLTKKQRGFKCLADVNRQIRPYGKGEEQVFRLPKVHSGVYNPDTITLELLAACEETAAVKVLREEIMMVARAIESQELLRGREFWMVLGEHGEFHD